MRIWVRNAPRIEARAPRVRIVHPLALFILGGWGLAFLGSQLLTPSFPAYGGRTTHEWLLELTESDYLQQQEALCAFAAMGEQAVAVLVQALNDRDSPAERLIHDFARRWPAVGIRNQQASERRAAALDALGAIARESATVTVPALPALIDLLNMPPASSGLNDIHRTKAATIIGGMGSAAADAVPVLMAMVRADPTGGSTAARAALRSLALIGASREQVGPLLVHCLRSPHEGMRRTAAVGLQEWGADSAFAVEPLRAALWHPNDAAFLEVAMALGQVGEAAREAAPDLIRGLKHESSMVRAVAAVNLARIGTAPCLAVEPLAEALKDVDVFVRSRAAWALGQLAEGSSIAAEFLAGALHDDSEAVQISVIEALGAIGPEASNVRGELQRAGSNRQAGLGKYVAAALAMIECPGEASPLDP